MLREEDTVRREGYILDIIDQAELPDEFRDLGTQQWLAAGNP